MDIRIGNDIRMQITLLGDGEYTQSNIVKLDAKLINTSIEPKHCHHFPKFYDPTPYTTHNSGVPTYHVHPHYGINEYCQFHPEFTEPHWWPNYCGFGVCSKPFCDHKCEHDMREIHLLPMIVDTNTIETVFEARHQKCPGQYVLIVKYTVYEPGYGPDNLHTYCADYGVVFNLVYKKGTLPPNPLYIPEEYTLTTEVDPEGSGEIIVSPPSITGKYHYGDHVILDARPAEGYTFKCWHDEVTDNPRQITIKNNVTYKAIFEGGAPIQKYTITVIPNYEERGFTTGSGEYELNESVSISATANEGFEFTQWSDGNNDNPRTIIVEGDATYTAMFASQESQKYSIQAYGAQGHGYVNGQGEFEYGDTAILTAYGYSGYEFDYWDNNPSDTTNPKIITVTQDETHVAYFKAIPGVFTITTAVTPVGSGTVSGGGTYPAGQSIYLYAIENEGYQFVKWQEDGYSVPNRTETVIEDATYTAVFRSIRRHIVVRSNDQSKGRIDPYALDGYYDEGEVITVTAIPNEGYKFTHWSDGDIEAYKEITVEDDATYIAYFETVPIYTITVNVKQGQENMGTVSPSGSNTYREGTQIQISAIPTDSNLYEFAGWLDGDTINPRQITVRSNATYTATFKEKTDSPQILYGKLLSDVWSEDLTNPQKYHHPNLTSQNISTLLSINPNTVVDNHYALSQNMRLKLGEAYFILIPTGVNFKGQMSDITEGYIDFENTEYQWNGSDTVTYNGRTYKKYGICRTTASLDDYYITRI